MSDTVLKNTSRKPGFSRCIRLDRFERESRRLLYLGFFVAVCIHALVAMVWKRGHITESNTEIPRVIALKLYEKPYLNQYVVPDRSHQFRPLQRYRSGGQTTPSVRTRQERLTAPHLEDQTGDSTFSSTPHVSETPLSIPEEVFSPRDFGLGEGPWVKRIPDDALYLTDEMIDIDNLDTGEYMGLIVIDPGDRYNMKGFLHIPSDVQGFEFDSVSGTFLWRFRDFVLKNYTGISLKIDPPVPLDSPNLQKYPMLYLASDTPFFFTKQEAENLRTYLENA